MEIKTQSENYNYEITANGVATVGATANIDAQGIASLNFNMRNATAFFDDSKSRDAIHTLLDDILNKAETNYKNLPVEVKDGI